MRRLAAALALAVAIAGCGNDDDGEDTPAGVGARASAADTPLWPPPTGEPSRPRATARAFVEKYVGVEDPALSEFRRGEPRAGEVEVYRRGEDGRALETVVAVIVLRKLDGRWSVMTASSPEVEVTAPDARAVVSSPLRVRGRGRGFEGNVVIEVRGQYATRPLATKAVVAGSAAGLRRFSARLAFDADGQRSGAIVAKTGSGIAAADGFEAFVVRFAGD
jgi:hypothetical protein